MFKPKAPVVITPRDTLKSGNSVWGSIIRDTGKKISKSETHKKIVSLLRRLPETDLSGLESVQIPSLRESSPLQKRIEGKWDGRCYRISTYNTHVHPHYRTLFEAIGKDNGS